MVTPLRRAGASARGGGVDAAAGGALAWCAAGLGTPV
jgi:hypothetical protein